MSCWLVVGMYPDYASRQFATTDMATGSDDVSIVIEPGKYVVRTSGGGSAVPLVV